MNDNKQSRKRGQGGQPTKNDKADYRYTVNLTEEENTKFMALFRRSESKVISRFIASMIFGRERAFNGMVECEKYTTYLECDKLY